MEDLSRNLMVLCVTLATVVVSENVFSDAPASPLPTPHFSRHTDLLEPAYEIEGFSFMPGAGVIDVDNDGYEDIYVVNGRHHPNALYRNIAGKRFEKVRYATGLETVSESTGIAVGDLNNDGYDDIYVANAETVGDGVQSNDGLDRLYVSNRDGTYRDITSRSGVNEPGFSTSVAMADYDKDGFLDIFVGRFVDFDFVDPVANRTNPTTYSRLYRNNGDLTFTDVTAEAGVLKDFNVWSAIWFDYDNDGWIDLVVGHEQGPISVFRNLGDGRFEDRTEVAGDVRFVGAWMGLTVGDFDNDGDFDFYASNISDLWGTTRDPTLPPLDVPPPETWDNQRNTFFINNGDGTFSDANARVGLPDDIKFGWGTVSADFNNDGWLDFYAAHNFSPVGVIGREREGASPGGLYVNAGDGTFKDYSYLSGTENFDRNGNYLDGRGVFRFDFNNDGQMDLFLVNTPQFVEAFPFGRTPIEATASPQLFRNLGSGGNWIVLDLVGRGDSNRDAIGAVVEVFASSGYQKRTIAGGGSAFASSSKRLHIGLGKAKSASLVIHWPDGSEQRVRHIPAGKQWRIVQTRAPASSSSEDEEAH